MYIYIYQRIYIYIYIYISIYIYWACDLASGNKFQLVLYIHQTLHPNAVKSSPKSSPACTTLEPKFKCLNTHTKTHAYIHAYTRSVEMQPPIDTQTHANTNTWGRGGEEAAGADGAAAEEPSSASFFSCCFFVFSVLHHGLTTLEIPEYST